MPARLTYLLALSVLVILPAGALAGASSTPFGYAPDPALQRESPAQLQARVRRSCVSTQGRIQNAGRGMQRGCGCYATRVMRSLDATELAAYRSTGVFNDGARAKAFAALDGCGLRRPG